MFAKVRGVEFKKVIGQLIGDKKGDVCLAWVDGQLFAQTTGNVIDEMVLPVLDYAAGDDGIAQATVLFDKSINLLSDGELTLFTSSTVLTLQQGNFRYNTRLQTVSRVDTSLFDGNVKTDFPESDIENLRNVLRSTLRISRSLKVEESTVHVVGGKAYIYYSNFAVIVDCELATCAMDTLSVAKLANLIANRRTGNTMYSHSEEKGVLSVHTAATSHCIVSVQRADERLSSALDSAIERSSAIGFYDFSKYQDKINVITQVYDKAPLELSIHKEGFGFFINNQSTQFTFGETKEQIVAITITPAQLIVLNKLLGNLNRVEILRGDRKLCFKGPRMTVLISGMLS